MKLTKKLTKVISLILILEASNISFHAQKCRYGKLNNLNKGVFDLPDYYSDEINKPYTEIGLGLTNIYKELRVEYIR